MKNIKCKNCANYIQEWCESILDSPRPDLHRNCDYFKHKTKFDNIKAMNIGKMSKYLVEIGWDCHNCSENERLSDNPLLRGEKCDEQCELHCKEWLEKDV